MKTKFIFFLFTVISCCILSGCEKEDEYTKKKNKVNRVTLKVFSNDPCAPVTVYGYETIGLVIRSKWEKEVFTKAWFTQLEAQCNDPTVLLTVEIYVNGKLKRRREDNGFAGITVKLK